MVEIPVNHRCPLCNTIKLAIRAWHDRICVCCYNDLRNGKLPRRVAVARGQIRAARVAHNLSLEAAAKQLRATKSRLARIERSSHLRGKTVLALAKTQWCADIFTEFFNALHSMSSVHD